MSDTNNVLFASLIHFKPGVTRAEAAEALRSIRHLLDIPAGAKVKDVVESYNPEHGRPIFYIP